MMSHKLFLQKLCLIGISLSYFSIAPASNSQICMGDLCWGEINDYIVVNLSDGKIPNYQLNRLQQLMQRSPRGASLPEVRTVLETWEDGQKRPLYYGWSSQDGQRALFKHPKVPGLCIKLQFNFNKTLLMSVSESECPRRNTRIAR
jgi:hypothetical protein